MESFQVFDTRSKYLIGKIKKTSLKNIKRNEIPFRIVRPHKKIY